MSKPIKVIFLAGGLSIAVALSACGGAPSKNAISPSPTTKTSSSPSPSASGVIIPVTSNPITNVSTAPGLSIIQAKAEDNVDPLTGKAIPDRLMLHVQNSSASLASGFEVYYTMTDVVTKASESYYFKLDGFSIKAKSSEYLYFDNQPGFGHFPENKFSIYRSSTNEVRFTIELSAQGFKPVTSTAIKSKGTGEKID